LMTFSKDLYDLETYKKIPLAFDFSKTLYNDILSYLPNPSWYISPEKKAKYHALCVMSGNFPQILWQNIESEISQMGCPTEGWKNYILQSTMNFLNHSDSLTGPLARNDFHTIQNNIKSLDKTKLQDLYKAFCSFKQIEVRNENQ
ncbi:MAG: DUF2520 domain-containing protein, partial [Bdellovibrionales bacterium]|nr:DUF2520 domain-containing protein [Bdellovibrionales bacterium]